MEEAREDGLNLVAQNPLLINEVLYKILDSKSGSPICSSCPFKKCRLVCKTWWKESLPRWRRTQWLNLTTNDSEAGRLLTDDEEPLKDEEKLHKCLWVGKFFSLLDHPRYKLRKYPFQKIHLFKCKFRENYWKTELFQDFHFVAGPFVTSLAIRKCTIYSEQDFAKIVFRLSPKLEYLSLSDNRYKASASRTYEPEDFDITNLLEVPTDVQPQLSHLKLSMVDFQSSPDDLLPLNWTRFLGHFPNLEKLELVKINRDDGEVNPMDEVPAMLNSIEILRNKGTLQRINALDILNIWESDCTEFQLSATRLLSLALPIKFLAYDIGHTHNETSGLEDVLKIGVETLETLIIYKAPIQLPLGNFPYGNSFPKLTELTLVGPIVNDLRFLEHMPHLKTLRLFQKSCGEYTVESVIPPPEVLAQLSKYPKTLERQEYLEDGANVVGNTDFTQMSHFTFPKLEELIIGNELCTAEKVEQLARLLPNVKRLRIGLDNEGFRALCKFWRGQEALDIHPYMVDEQGFTGIARDDPEATRFPNITDLKNLRRFGMGESTDEYDKLVDLTDFSLEHGLLHLKHLEVVSLWCSPEKMSDDAYEQLKASFPPFPYSSVYRLSID